MIDVVEQETGQGWMQEGGYNLPSFRVHKGT